MKLYTIEETANMLNTTKANVYKLIRNKELSAIKFGECKVKGESLDSFLAANSENSTINCFSVIGGEC